MASLGFPASSSWAAKGFGFIGLVGEFIGLIEFVGLIGSIGLRVEGRSRGVFLGFQGLEALYPEPQTQTPGVSGSFGMPCLAAGLDDVVVGRRVGFGTLSGPLLPCNSRDGMKRDGLFDVDHAIEDLLGIIGIFGHLTCLPVALSESKSLRWIQVLQNLRRAARLQYGVPVVGAWPLVRFAHLCQPQLEL